MRAGGGGVVLQKCGHENKERKRAGPRPASSPSPHIPLARTQPHAQQTWLELGGLVPAKPGLCREGGQVRFPKK